MAHKRTFGLGTIASIVLTVIQATHPQWLGNHPWILPFALVCLGISAILFLLQFGWAQKLAGVAPVTPALELPAVAPIRAKSEVTAPATATATGIGSLTINNLPTQAIPRIAPSLPTEPVEEVEFELQPRWLDLIYAPQPGEWREILQPSGGPAIKRAFVVTAVRKVPAVGLKTRGPMEIVAVVNVSSPIESHHISQAYWVAKSGYQVKFNAGNRNVAIIGVKAGPLFTSYVNEHQDEAFSMYSTPHRPLGPRFDLPKAGLITAEISLFDAHGHRTVAHRKYRVSFDDADKEFFEETK